MTLYVLKLTDLIQWQAALFFRNSDHIYWFHLLGFFWDFFCFICCQRVHVTQRSRGTKGVGGLKGPGGPNGPKGLKEPKGDSTGLNFKKNVS